MLSMTCATCIPLYIYPVSEVQLISIKKTSLWVNLMQSCSIYSQDFLTGIIPHSTEVYIISKCYSL